MLTIRFVGEFHLAFLMRQRARSSSGIGNGTTSLEKSQRLHLEQTRPRGLVTGGLIPAKFPDCVAWLGPGSLKAGQAEICVRTNSANLIVSNYITISTLLRKACADLSLCLVVEFVLFVPGYGHEYMHVPVFLDCLPP